MATTLPKVFKGRKVVGIRIPDNPIATSLATRIGNPLLTTSVTDEGDGSVIYPESLALKYDSTVDLLIDGGEGSDIPSTVVDITDSSSPAIIREGAGAFED